MIEKFNKFVTTILYSYLYTSYEIAISKMIKMLKYLQKDLTFEVKKVILQ